MNKRIEYWKANKELQWNDSGRTEVFQLSYKEKSDVWLNEAPNIQKKWKFNGIAHISFVLSQKCWIEMAVFRSIESFSFVCGNVKELECNEATCDEELPCLENLKHQLSYTQNLGLRNIDLDSIVEQAVHFWHQRLDASCIISDMIYHFLFT